LHISCGPGSPCSHIPYDLFEMRVLNTFFVVVANSRIRPTLVVYMCMACTCAWNPAWDHDDSCGLTHAELVIVNKDQRVSPPTFQADVWALGTTLLECWTGRKPYMGCRDFQIIAYLQSRVPPTFECKHRPLPKELADLLSHCLAAVPEERPSALNLLQRLKQAKPKLMREQQEPLRQTPQATVLPDAIVQLNIASPRGCAAPLDFVGHRDCNVGV
jgi:serine/threonine protein kinase